MPVPQTPVKPVTELGNGAPDSGYDIDALAAQLQDEGAASFVKSWNELMTVLASKAATLKAA